MSDASGNAPKFSSNPRPFILLGYLLIFSTFGVLGTWAAFAKLDSAVLAGGSVAVERIFFTLSAVSMAFAPGSPARQIPIAQSSTAAPLQ